MKQKKLSSGFTLIELLVVVAIIGILAATILASLGGARQKARDSRIMSELSGLRAQMELYYISNGSYGNTNNQCATGPFDTAGTDNASAIVRAIANDLNGSPTNFLNVGCWSNAESWAVQAWLPGVKHYWCVDSGGRSLDIGLSGVWGNGGVYRCTP